MIPEAEGRGEGGEGKASDVEGAGEGVHGIIEGAGEGVAGGSTDEPREEGVRVRKKESIFFCDSD